MQGHGRNMLMDPRLRHAQSQPSRSNGLVATTGALQLSDMATLLEAMAAQLRASAGIDRPINIRIRIGVVHCELPPRLIDTNTWPPQGMANWPAFDDEIVQ